jgi:Aspartyl protease/PDZ domain
MHRVIVRAVLGCGVLAAALSFAPSPAGAAAQPSVAQLVRASGAALGLDALKRVRSVHLRGVAKLVGVDGTGDLWIDLRDGRFAQYSQAGPLSGAGGYDGAHAWNRDAGGVVWNDDGRTGRYGALESVYQNRFALWSPGYGGAKVVASVQTDHARRYDVLRVTPADTPPFDLWLDATTHLPARAVATVGTVTSTTVYGDYRKVAGIMMPFTQDSVTNGDTTTFKVTAAVPNDPGTETALRRPAMHVDDFTLPGGGTTIPFELIDNHVALPVTINGKGPYRFLFDTGGANLIDEGVAKELGLGAAGNANGSGVGTATEAIQFGTADALHVGGATLRKQVFVVGPVRAGFGMSSGKPVDGLIGFEVLSRFVTTFDYGKNEIVLRAPGSPAPAGGTTIPFVFNGEHVEVPCAIDAFPGRCTIDTGSRVSLSVLSPFLAAHPSIVPPNATAVGANGFGIGGAALGKLGRTTLQLGTYTIPDLIADLSTQTKGAFADPYTAANIGAGALKRFAITFDYAKQTMTLIPDAAFATRDTYDRSGTFLIAQGGKIVVADVRPGTPGAEAGVVKGDVLTAAGGKDAAALGLAGLRELFGGAAGSAIPLTLSAKDGSTKTVTLTLRDII